MHVVATAGHVDHGKSTLVTTLTGMDPDRFAEEKARGLTIDLGFAWTTLPSGCQLAFVDVPGHVRFLHNMLAGAGTVHACVFVVAATEGWKPQSEEHLRILELLDVKYGIIALTKVALVDDELLLQRREDVAARVAGTFLEGSPICEVDAPSGIGLSAFTKALDELVAALPSPVDRGRARLWIDRSFTMRGAGTVVTGTLAGGSLAVGDVLSAVPGPLPDRSPLEVRVRGLQSHKQALHEVTPGQRVAVNVTGVSHTQLGRGQALVHLDQWAPATTIDASLTVLAALGHDVGRQGAYQAYLGSSEHSVAIRILGGDALAPGEDGFIRMHFPVALALLPGDRYVLRESGRSETIGGGEVLDVSPVRSLARARPDRSVDRVISERLWLTPDELDRLTGERRVPTLLGWIVHPAALHTSKERIRRAVEESGTLGLEIAQLSDRERAVLSTMDEITSDGTWARFGRTSSIHPLADHPYLAMLDRAPFAPPTPEESGVSKEELRELVRSGRVIEREGCYFSPTAVKTAARCVARLLAESPEGITASAVRNELRTTRKYALPILSYLDAAGITRRRGDLRIAGPRLGSDPTEEGE
ncbi:MAG TPA: selenocysteine-specific translation elongation factor [Acidimicrobiales bacterium]|jgi:selenocysteine-specific elongation factor